MRNRIKRGFYDQMAAWSMLFRQRAMAMRWYRRMLELDPDDALALASLGFQHAQAGDRRAALALFDRVVTLKPDDADAHFNRGFLLQQMNDHEAAMAAFGEAIARNAAHDRAHYGLALSLIATHRLDEALAPLKKNTRLQPMSPYGWYQLARVQRDLGHHDEAQKILDHLATFEPKVARQLERDTGLKATPR
jgi:tetratricopeptide (TPR) repeat protein